MKGEIKLASNLAPFSRLSDRFVPGGYTAGYTLEKALAKIAKVKGLDGVNLGWPGRFRRGAEIRKLLARHGLVLGTLDTDIYTEARFRHGSLSNRDPRIRRAAVERAMATIDAAEEAGAPDVNLWLGHDGFDYPFQGHYADAWNWIVDGLQEIAMYNPRMPIGVEPKCKEPRANQYVANTGKALWLVNKIDRPHVGITLDFGHCLAALENPAEALVLCHREDRLQQVHLNDNYRDWDHDLVPGSVTLWEHVEFFFWMRKVGYRGWCHADIYPYREEGVAVVERTVQVFRKCLRVADKLIDMKIERILRTGDHLEILRKLWDMIDA